MSAEEGNTQDRGGVGQYLIMALAMASSVGEDSAFGPSSLIGALGNKLFAPGAGETTYDLGLDGRYHAHTHAPGAQDNPEAQRIYNAVGLAADKTGLTRTHLYRLAYSESGVTPMANSEGLRQTIVDTVNHMETTDWGQQILKDNPQLQQLRDAVVDAQQKYPTLDEYLDALHSGKLPIIAQFANDPTLSAYVTAGTSRMLLEQRYGYVPGKGAQFDEAMSVIGGEQYLINRFGDSRAHAILDRDNGEDITPVLTAEELNNPLNADLKKFGEKLGRPLTAHDLVGFSRDQYNADLTGFYGSVAPRLGWGGEIDDRARKYFDYATKTLGLDAEHAAAMLGNGWAESRLRANGPDGDLDTGGSSYMFQWHLDRKTAIDAAALKAGRDPKDPYFDMDYAVAEMRARDPDWFNHHGVGALTDEWNSKFEVSRDGDGVRVPYAENVLRAVQSGGPLVATGQPNPLGNQQINTNAEIAYLRGNAHPYPTEDCMGNVRRAYEAGGGSLGQQPVRPYYAADYAFDPARPNYLGQIGLTLVAHGHGLNTGPDYVPTKGDIVIWNRVAAKPGDRGHPSGHAAMYDGEKWISDFAQQNMAGLKGLDNTYEFAVYRNEGNVPGMAPGTQYAFNGVLPDMNRDFQNRVGTHPFSMIPPSGVIAPPGTAPGAPTAFTTVAANAIHQFGADQFARTGKIFGDGNCKDGVQSALVAGYRAAGQAVPEIISSGRFQPEDLQKLGWTVVHYENGQAPQAGDVTKVEAPGHAHWEYCDLGGANVGQAHFASDFPQNNAHHSANPGDDWGFLPGDAYRNGNATWVTLRPPSSLTGPALPPVQSVAFRPIAPGATAPIPAGNIITIGDSISRNLATGMQQYYVKTYMETHVTPGMDRRQIAALKQQATEEAERRISAAGVGGSGVSPGAYHNSELMANANAVGTNAGPGTTVYIVNGRNELSFTRDTPPDKSGMNPKDWPAAQAKYAQDIGNFIDTLKKSGAKVVMVSLPSEPNHPEADADIQKMNALNQRVAAQHGVPFVDVNSGNQAYSRAQDAEGMHIFNQEATRFGTDVFLRSVPVSAPAPAAPASPITTVSYTPPPAPAPAPAPSGVTNDPNAPAFVRLGVNGTPLAGNRINDSVEIASLSKVASLYVGLHQMQLRDQAGTSPPGHTMDDFINSHRDDINNMLECKDIKTYNASALRVATDAGKELGLTYEQFVAKVDQEVRTIKVGDNKVSDKTHITGAVGGGQATVTDLALIMKRASTDFPQVFGGKVNHYKPEVFTGTTVVFGKPGETEDHKNFAYMGVTPNGETIAAAAPSTEGVTAGIKAAGTAPAAAAPTTTASSATPPATTAPAPAPAAAKPDTKTPPDPAEPTRADAGTTIGEKAAKVLQTASGLFHKAAEAHDKRLAAANTQNGPRRRHNLNSMANNSHHPGANPAAAPGSTPSTEVASADGIFSPRLPQQPPKKRSDDEANYG